MVFAVGKNLITALALVLIALLVLAAIVFSGITAGDGLVTPEETPASAVSSVPWTPAPSDETKPVYVAGLKVEENSLKGMLYFIEREERKRVALSGTLKVRIESNDTESFSAQFPVNAGDFRAQVSSRTSFEKGYQEITEVTDYYYDFEIPLEGLKKGLSDRGTAFFEFASLQGGNYAWKGSVEDLPRDTALFAGSPDSMSAPQLLARREKETISYEFFFTLSEKSVPVSSAGTLAVSAENSDGKEIYSKSVQVQAEDFSFKPINTSAYTYSYNTRLKYVFSFSSEAVPEGECISAIKMSFTAANGQLFEGEMKKRKRCYYNCELYRLC